MALSPQAVLTVKIVTWVLILACVIFRYVTFRLTHPRRTMSIHSQLSHASFLIAAILDLTATLESVGVLAKEMKLKDQGYGGAQLDSKLVNSSNLKIFFSSHLIYYLSIIIIKAGYLFFYCELYRLAQATTRSLLIGAIVVFGGTGLGGILIIFCWCTPVGENWNVQTTNDQCPFLFSPVPFSILGALNILSDLAILTVPLMIISTLTTTRLESNALILIFSIGGTSIVASLARLIVVVKLLKNPSTRYTWNTLHVYMLWSHAEVFFGVLAFTLPGFRFLILKWLGTSAPSKESTELGSWNATRRDTACTLSTLNGAYCSNTPLGQESEMIGPEGDDEEVGQRMSISRVSTSDSLASGSGNGKIPTGPQVSTEIFEAHRGAITDSRG